MSIDTKLVKGFIDVGFKNSTLADSAAVVKMVVEDKVIPITRTRFSGDENLFISFDSLPTTMGREELIEGLGKGLAEYGEIIQLEMQKYDLLPNLAMSKAIAMIKPKPEVAKDLKIIPRRAFLYDNEVPTSEFRIHPEAAPPICSSCQSAGHRIRDCPSLIEGLDRSEETEMDHEDDIDFDSACTAYPWGETANYIIVKPVTQKEKQEAKKALREAEATSSTSQEETSTQREHTSTSQTSISIDTSNVGNSSTTFQDTMDTAENEVETQEDPTPPFQNSVRTTLSTNIDDLPRKSGRKKVRKSSTTSASATTTTGGSGKQA